MSNESPTKVMVKVGDKEYLTIVDAQGVQRFKTNNLLRHLVDSGMVNLERLNTDYGHGKFSQAEYLDFYTGIGYSLCALQDLSFFENLEIENPLW